MPQQDDAIGFTERSGTCFSTSSADGKAPNDF